MTSNKVYVSGKFFGAVWKGRKNATGKFYGAAVRECFKAY